jgi:hypothetical protein
VPAWVEARTRGYREALDARCRRAAEAAGATDGKTALRAPAEPVVDNHTVAH